MNDSQSAFSLKGKVALITGAATGIGRAIAKAYAAAGADVVIDYAPDQASPDDLLAEIKANALGRAVAVQVDISDVTKHAQLLETAITHFSRLDILVNNAARKGKTLWENVTPELWDDVVGTNLRGPYFLTQAAARLMIQRGIKGRVINVTSTHDTNPLRRNSVYCISKSGLAMTTKSLALELAPTASR